MYNIIVNIQELDSTNKLHITLCDFLLKNAVDNMSFSLRESIIDGNDVFVYLIQDNNNNWTISCLEFELPSKFSYYKTRVVIKVNNIFKVVKDETKRCQLIKALIPSKATLTRYTNVLREANKELN